MVISTLSFLIGLAGGSCLVYWMSASRPPVRESQGRRLSWSGQSTETTPELQQSVQLPQVLSNLPSDRIELYSTLSYEIRTPITSIIGYLDLLEEENWRRPNSLELIAIIKRNSQHLLEIINNLRDLARMGTGHIESEVERFSTSKFFRELEAWAIVRDPRQEQHRLQLNVSSSMPTDLKGDIKNLQHILYQLIKSSWRDRQATKFRINACLATGPKGQMLRFEMADDGKLIPEEAGRQLPDGESLDAQADGQFRLNGAFGLGLNLSKLLIESIGGTLHVVPQENDGNSYELSIPVEVVESPAPNRVETRLVGERAVSQSGKHVFKFDPGKTELNSGLSGRHGIAKGAIKVLLVEDGLDNQRLIRHVLKKVGMEVEVAENGAVGLEQAMHAWQSEMAYDVILMDMHMPVMDGYEATRKLRENGYDGVIIALTAHALKQDRDHCLGVGCDDYTTKPVNRAELVNLIRSRVKVEAKSGETLSASDSEIH